MALLVGTIWGSEKETTLNKGSTNNELLLSIENFVSINQASDLAMEIENYTGADSFTFPASLPIGIVEQNSFSNLTTQEACQLGFSFENNHDAEKNFMDAENGPTTVLKLPMQGFVLTSTGTV